MNRIFVFLTLTFVLSFTCLAQIGGNPIVKKKGKLVIEISNMLGDAGGMECLKETKPIIGTIVKRWFEDDEITLARVIIRDAKDKRKSINVDSEHLFLLGRTTNEILSDFLEKNKKVQVWYYDCRGGGSGVFPYANRVKAL
jgi:hypothetical protein